VAVSERFDVVVVVAEAAGLVGVSDYCLKTFVNFGHDIDLLRTSRQPERAAGRRSGRDHHRSV
jgi:hypothetical protein